MRAVAPTTRPFGLKPCQTKKLLRPIGSQSGRAEPFNENAAQVKRLITRDKKEFLGNETDILDKYTTEFGVEKAEKATSSEASVSASPFSSSSSSSSATPFGTSSPFGSNAKAPAGFSTPSPANPFKNSIEPRGLTPSMGPDPIVKEKAVNPLKSITITQVVLFCSFTLIIALMLVTYQVVMSTGAIRLAGVE